MDNFPCSVYLKIYMVYIYDVYFKITDHKLIQAWWP